MRVYVLAMIVLLALLVVTVALIQKPIEAPLVVDQAGPGPWAEYASANRVEIIDQYACMRLMVPYNVTGRPKGVVRT